MAHLDLLFRDYEIQMEAQKHRDYEADARELRQLELSRVTAADRLAAQLGQSLTIHGATGDIWRGRLATLGLGWLQLTTDAGDLILPLTEILYWEGGNHQAIGEAQEVSRKLTLGSALRALSSAQRHIHIHHSGGQGLTSSGQVRSVGADYCEIVVMKAQKEDARGVRVAPRCILFSSIAAIRVAG
ncbi:MAG: hypothetical protein Q4A03_00590 [Rothia sp. (in: high G+C Gram-positive bacteria)]|nr:hypothetical protein [Rothia sp. (in: high G+C Gram-positive bacteria)]